MSKYIITEIPPITEQDSFVIFERNKYQFNYPIHTHKQCELNFIENAKGAQRIVGDHVSIIDNLEMVLITNESLEHTWVNHNNNTSNPMHEITIQFNNDLLSGGLFQKKQFITVQQMIHNAKHGISFSKEKITEVKPIIDKISHVNGFNAIILFLELLYNLSLDTNYTILSHQMFSNIDEEYDNKRLSKIMNFIYENYTKEITLTQVAEIANMSDTSFSRFIKLRTGKGFIDSLNEFRVSAVARELIDHPSDTIADIAYRCGFNNISNFNRVFKNKRGLTPAAFREKYMKKKIII